VRASSLSWLSVKNPVKSIGAFALSGECAAL